MLGFVVIVILYAAIGVMAAAGAICLSRKIFSRGAEQIFYAMFLMVVAALYLAFASYFKETTAWRLETVAVLGFVAIGVLGTRLRFVLIVGYPLHAFWDLLHEVQVHGPYSVFESGRLTAIPLAYGFFCAAFDLCIAAYFYRQQTETSRLQKSKSPP